MKLEAIEPDGVYVDASLNRWRRVIAVHENKHADGETYVIYSLGTDVNRWCLLRTFARWAVKRITVDPDGMVEEHEPAPDALRV